MDIGFFYFLNDQYFVDFPDDKLMQNKEMVNGVKHDRPCFYAFMDNRSGLYWLIPISSRTNKYKGVYKQKVERYGKCDTIKFGNVLGHEKAFLIQNMCPATDKYITCKYIDQATNVPVRLDGAFEKELRQSANAVLALQRKGAKLIFPDVLQIEKKLLVQLTGETDE